MSFKINLALDPARCEGVDNLAFPLEHDYAETSIYEGEQDFICITLLSTLHQEFIRKKCLSAITMTPQNYPSA